MSIRLHNERDSVEKRRGRVEEENEELRVRLQDLEVAKQVLQAEMEKSREVRDWGRSGGRREGGLMLGCCWGGLPGLSWVQRRIACALSCTRSLSSCLVSFPFFFFSYLIQR